MNELRQRYLQLNDYELLSIVFFDHSEYTEEALNIAKVVLAEKGLDKPSEELLQKVKEYRETPADEFDDFGKGLPKQKEIRDAIKKKDYLFIGKWLFWLVVAQALYSQFNQVGEINIGSLALEIIFNIALFGIIPVIFFFVYSMRLSKEQRKEKKLSLFMPKYVLFMYVISLLIFFVLVILPRLKFIPD